MKNPPNPKYSIVLFENKQRLKVLYKCMKKDTVYEHWRDFKSQKKPMFVKLQGGKRRKELIHELALLLPYNRWTEQVWVKDSLGRNEKAILADEKFRIKEIIPYWVEEKVYDHQNGKRIYYDEMMSHILPITESAQIFTLNSKMFVQVEDDVRYFSCKNVIDTERLFEIVKNDLLGRKINNFLFIKDVSTQQRKMLYAMLQGKGYKKSELFRHYSY
jgi:hypothetical protein